MIGYRCFQCEHVQAADYSGWSCPGCGGNLDVVNDHDTILRQIEKAPYDSTRIPLRIGNTPLYAAERLGRSIGLRNLYLKDDTVNPSASSKDRASGAVVVRAMDAGAKIVSAASTGNAGSSLACIAAAAGLQAIVFVPESAPIAKLTQALSFGATVLSVRGSYDDAFDLCMDASKRFHWFNRSTGINPFTREGKKVCAWEIWAALGGRIPDRVIVPAGDGNILSGMWKGWRELREVGLVDQLPKIDCAQSNRSDAISRMVRTMGRSDQPDWATATPVSVTASTIADSISVDRPRDETAAARAVVESGGMAVTVSDKEILSAIPEMASMSGIFPEPAAATPLAVAKLMVTERLVAPDEIVVCLVSGNGLKDIERARTVTTEPFAIDPSLDAVEAAIARISEKAS